MKPLLHVLTGPTAVGKTEWALRWAEARGAEIVSCDSLLFYRGMDLGTAKPTAAERARDRRRSFERLAWFCEGWVARSPADAAVLGDMRYSLSTEAFDPIWGIRFTPPGEVAEVAWVNRSRDRRIGLGETWSEWMGRDARFLAVPGCGPSGAR
jgi:hypothetical protein